MLHDKQKPRFETATAATEGSRLMSLEKAHLLLGHMNHRLTIKTAKHLGWGQLRNCGKVCQSYAKAKAKQKAVPQSRKEKRLAIPNKRIYHNLATVKAPSDVAEKVSKPVWQLFVDEARG